MIFATTTSVRVVPKYDTPTLPAAVRYRFCAAPVHVPPDFTPDMVTRSAKKPPVMLRRRAVNGYNGLGTHNRAPNVHTRSARTHRGSAAAAPETQTA